MNIEEEITLDEITNIEQSVDEREPSNEEMIVQLVKQRESMETQAYQKVTHAREQLLLDLETYAAKWKTASGFKLALDTLREVENYEDFTQEINDAKFVACAVVATVELLVKEIEKLTDTEKFAEAADRLIDEMDIYVSDFIYYVDKNSLPHRFIATELLTLQMCQQFGPALCDIHNYWVSAQDQIKEVTNKINELNFVTEE